MKRQVANLLWACLALFSTLLPSCAPEDPGGSAFVGVSAQALSSTDVTKVTVTVSGTAISPNIVHDLVKTGGQWKGIIGRIPVGSGRTFSAEAFDSTNTKIYEGSATNVTISKGAPALVTILLQQTTAPSPFQNTVPDITSLTSSTSQAGQEDDVQLAATATDVDGDTLAYAWTATNGTFPAGNTGASVSWRAPAAPFTGDVTISLEVSDGSKGGKTGTSIVVSVQSQFGKGKAKVSVSFNTWPEVSQMTSSLDPVNTSQSTNLDVSASDPDGDSLTYTWAAVGAECQAGSFANANIRNPTWTAPATAPASSKCSLQVTVTDSRGGSTTGTMTVNVGAQTTANIAPQFTTTFQSTDEISALGLQVILRVEASDPESQAITFAWSSTAGAGSLGTPTNTASSSEIQWTAPAGVCPYTVSVDAQDSSGAKSTYTFEMNCVITSSGAWSNGTSAASCGDYRQPPAGYIYAGQTGDGVYSIDPDGIGGNTPFSAYCDQSTDGGGWTLCARSQAQELGPDVFNAAWGTNSQLHTRTVNGGNNCGSFGARNLMFRDGTTTSLQIILKQANADLLWNASGDNDYEFQSTVNNTGITLANATNSFKTKQRSGNNHLSFVWNSAGCTNSIFIATYDYTYCGAGNQWTFAKHNCGQSICYDKVGSGTVEVFVK